MSSGVPTPRWLTSDWDGPILLAATKGVALVEARDYHSFDHVLDVEFAGWMHDVGWDRETYESKREFEEESGYTGWWANGSAPVDRLVTETAMPGWTAVLCDGCVLCDEDETDEFTGAGCCPEEDGYLRAQAASRDAKSRERL